MTLRRSIWIDARLNVVHSYFTSTDKMVQWTGQNAEIEPWPGGLYRLDMGKGGWLEGRFTNVESDRICWEVDIPGGQDVTEIEVRLSSEKGGTRVDITQTGLPIPFDQIAGRGWDHHLARLSVVSTGGKVGPDSLCERDMQSLA